MVQHGSVYQRRKGPGRPWTARWRENGVNRSQGGFATEEDGWVWLREKLYELDHGIAIKSSNITLAEYLPAWLARQWRIRPSTRASYEVAINSYILPRLGDARLQNLDSLAIDEWISSMVAHGYAVNTIRNGFIVLSSALNDAVEHDLIRKNPCRSKAVRLPPDDQREIAFWTEAEAERFIEVIAGHTYEMLFRFLLASQVRLGEAIGLPWDCLDLDHRSVDVKWNYRVADKRVAEVKSRKSRRRVSLDADTCELLRLHRDQLAFRRKSGFPWTEQGLVFPNDRGGPTRHATVGNNLRRLCQRHGLRVLTPHGLRHTGATFLLKAGVPLHVVSRRLGHSSVAFTADIYAHVLPSQEQDVAERLAALLNRSAS